MREMPMAEFLVPMPYLVEARFGQWDLILTEPVPVIPPDRPLGTSNRAKNVAEVAQEVLAGEIASAGGDRKAAIEKFTRAVRLEDALIYEEPPMWYAPVRERLATELLAAGRRQEAVTIYREDLRINPGNPRSIYGLAQTLKALGRVAEAATLDREFRRVWRYADSRHRHKRQSIALW